MYATPEYNAQTQVVNIHVLSCLLSAPELA